MNTPRTFLVSGVLSLVAITALLGGVDNAIARKYYDRSNHRHDPAILRFGAYDRAYSPAPQRDFQLQGRGLGE